jgi:hypothetical protein
MAWSPVGTHPRSIARTVATTIGRRPATIEDANRTVGR